MSLLDPTYVFLSRPTLKTMVENKDKKKKQKANDIILKATEVSLTSDMWTSIHMDAYLAITYHFINESDELTSILLIVEMFPEKHMAASIATVKTAVMEEWSIQSMIICLVTDGAANMLACASILDARHRHVLNLVVNKAIDLTPGLKDKRGKARS